MYLNDIQRSEFYSTIGLDARQFDKYVIRKTNQSASTVFPVILDVDHPQFFELMEKCNELNCQIIKTEQEEGSDFGKLLIKIPLISNMIFNFLKIYFLPAIETKYIWTEN
jgi:magnesium-protoporphyrin IX monomethyl ester (oxidative) cyclase